ncbi:MAG TPA: hypothetical protein VFR55_08585 [Dehalococcoidia bacterium]|nr:hypothetical protein [Dehalococcoidia bacterium]
MKEVHPDYAGQVVLYAVGASPVDSLVELESFRQREGHPWPVAAPEGRMLQDLNVAIRSTKIAFNADGIIRYRAGFGDADADEWRLVFEDLAGES